jgi:hypothetical protein
MLSGLAVGLAMALAMASTMASAPARASGAELPDSFQLAPEVLRLRINGLTVNGRVFTSGLEPARACALLERHWQLAGDGGRVAPCQRFGRWLLISHPAGRFVQTAQLERSGDGSEGFLSEADPLAPRVAPGYPRLPVPPGARLVNSVQSMLDRDTVTQFTLELPWAPAASLTRLRQLARDKGWTSVAGSAANVADFQRGGLAVRAVALSGGRGCTLVLVEHRPAGSAP